MDDILRLIERARFGDKTATQSIIESLRDQITALTELCGSLGWHMADVFDAVSHAISIAIETFDLESQRSFSEYAEECMVRMIRRRLSSESSLSN